MKTGPSNQTKCVSSSIRSKIEYFSREAIITKPSTYTWKVDKKVIIIKACFIQSFSEFKTEGY